MKKKQKKGYKLSDETVEKLKIQEIIKKEEEEKNKSPKIKKREEKKKIKEEKKNKKSENKISIPKAFETIFCLVYLGFLFVCIGKFFSLAKFNKLYVMLGCLTTVLAFGDSFHLIPRILYNLRNNRN